MEVKSVPPPSGSETVSFITLYKIEYRPGNLASSAAWALLGTAEEAMFYHSPALLGDYCYRAYHRFDGYVSGVLVSTGAWLGPGDVKISGYIHDGRRGSWTDSENEEGQLGMGPGWFFKYQLQEDAYTTIKIYPPGTTTTSVTNYGFQLTFSSAPLRTLIHKVPRSRELIDSSWWNTDEWDCRDDSGTIVSNGIYYVQTNAYDRNWVAFDPGDIETGRRSSVFESIPVDIIRIMKIMPALLVDYTGKGTIKYRLTASAAVTIKIYAGGTTFSGIEKNPQSGNYGEALPKTGAVLHRTLKFYRAAGNWEEDWDGTDSSGNYLPDGIYTFSISAINDYRRIATDEEYNDRPLWSNATIMRTLPPSGTGSSTGLVMTSSSSVIVSRYSPPRFSNTPVPGPAVYIELDPEISINPSLTEFEVYDPSGKTIAGAPFYSGNRLGINIPGELSPGQYSVRIKLVDYAGRYWQEAYTFKKKGPVLFSASLVAYPNPVRARAGSIKIAFNGQGGKVNFRIYNVLGEKLAETEVQTSPFVYDCSALGNGVYFWTASAATGEKVTNSFMVAK